MWIVGKTLVLSCNRAALRSISITSRVTQFPKSSVEEDDSSRVDHSEAFRHARIGTFFQEKPVLQNPYLSNGSLKAFLKRHIPDNYFSEINDDLTRFGERIVSEIDEKGNQCEQNPPTLTQYDAWGKRIDQINTCDAWKSMKTLSAEEGLIAIGYERNYGEVSRIYQMAKLFLFGASSGLYSCPLAMTDGAAKVFESIFPDTSSNSSIFGNAYRRLTSRNPDQFWTSGQWMTEKRGGSDVANGTETVANKQLGGSYKLYGYKWFTSATDADMVLTLARIADDNTGEVIPGSRGLSLFFMETRGEHGKNLHSGLNGLQVQRLKNKLGTRQLPTAEMLLDGAVAHQLGEESLGVRSISDMLTICRIYTCLMGISGMSRALQLSVDYSHRRSVFGSRLCDNSLHVQTLARMDLETRAAFLIIFELIRLLGLEETKPDPESSGILRLMTPICKLYTAKQVLKVISEALESFGGMGYLEDTGLPKLLRDAQVLSIWEGTTNVLSLDMLRAIEKSNGEVAKHFFARVIKTLENVKESSVSELHEPADHVEKAAKGLSEYVHNMLSKDRNEIMNAARDLSYSFARVYIATLLLDHAVWSGADQTDVYAARRWCAKVLCPVVHNEQCGEYSSKSSDMDKEIVFRSYQGDV